ncbi:methyltransferase [Ramlibacter sp. MMS24-I3-19]|uniref:methyltransferase n=1 Tax=Ramlibacter sp. MMS24-I3-19 TaxID=3416606 RepID=UPI003D06492E
MDPIPAPARLWLLATGHFLPRCLHVLSELGVADHVGDEPIGVAALAQRSGCDAPTLARMLRLLETAGLFQQVGDGWAHTELSRHLRSDHPQSMRAFARMIGGPIQWAAAGELASAAQTGQAAVKRVVPGGMWDYFKDHPDDARVFDAAMTSKSFAEIAALLPSFDFSPYARIADIGGGRGHVLAAILEATPSATGILFDLPRVVAGAAPAPRMQVQGGDFFHDELPRADAYIVSQVLHDWADDDAVAILRAVRRSAQPHSHLLVIEQVLPTTTGPHPAKVLDVVMLALTGGRERTANEYAALFQAGGFRLDRVVPTAGPTSVLVGMAG